MSAVVFNFGSCPTLDAQDAEDLAELLRGVPKLAALHLVQKLCEQVSELGTSTEIRVNAVERDVIATVLDSLEMADLRPSWIELRDELRRA